MEAFFIGVSKADVLSKLEESGVTKEISYSNFGLGREYSGELIERCVRIAEGLKEKLKNY
ncbi:hypothetical protein HS1genome_2343 [Sulfodiicoccus acidiphilus]|uniref:Uncharacterized protein n=1 Tax=Sulfodiicoccus acidiphilus TaxID=1670455 RepID=A0A348B702_9CREN|nr:hypothetical protein HS1genome_2343 [Sulfodiicoccus acidiphilus]